MFVVLRFLLLCDSESISYFTCTRCLFKSHFRHVFARITPLFNILTEFGIFTKHTTDEIFETSAAALGCPAYIKTEFCCFEMGSFFSYNLLYIKLEC